MEEVPVAKVHFWGTFVGTLLAAPKGNFVGNFLNESRIQRLVEIELARSPVHNFRSTRSAKWPGNGSAVPARGATARISTITKSVSGGSFRENSSFSHVAGSASVLSSLSSVASALVERSCQSALLLAGEPWNAASARPNVSAAPGAFVLRLNIESTLASTSPRARNLLYGRRSTTCHTSESPAGLPGGLRKRSMP